MTLYIVTQIGWEYDDNTYQRPECGGGVPVKAFRSLAKAEAERDRLNAEAAETEGDMTHCAKGDDGNWAEVPITDFYEVVAVEEGDLA